ncbi:transporter [Amycolatopsis sp. NBRC 101858]|uniref:RDD family protein n=1 Tax=Amycolatopsis sp. NBRC 101858 TaxID=3032200 RepID=UPI0024A5CE75|nr:RDD family protein [Amycolatopsis sp. NBRC 101858]GLY39421.1 transporter [Amycolatopsis sp. NBRC 101858]
MTDPYGQQPFGQQPGGQQPFGQPPPGQAPPPYGQAAPYGQPAPFGQPGNPFGAPQNYANWGQRALGWLIDMGPLALLYLIFIIVAIMGKIGILQIVVILGTLAWIGWAVFNRWIQQGNTGQSLGKRVAKIKLVSEATGQPIGAGMAFVRDLAHFVDGVICYVGWLWPLWDDKSQTLADKIVGTVVVNADDAGPYGQPGTGQPGAQPFAGGYPPPGQQPGQFGQQPGGFPQQTPSGGFDQPQPGGFPQQPAPGGFGQQPQPGGFDQPQSGGFGQPLAPPPGQQPPSAFDEQAERTQMLRPEGQGEPEATQKLQPGQFGQPPNDQPPHH